MLPKPSTVRAPIKINGSVFDFINGSLSSLITATRASSATYIDSDGDLQTAATDVMRSNEFAEHSPGGVAQGFLIEEQRTNSVLYSNRPAVSYRLVITGVTGTFEVGEDITTSSTGSGELVEISGTVALIFGTTGTFSGTLTGATSGATATISSSQERWRISSAGTGVAPVVTDGYASSPFGPLTASRIIFDKGAGTTTGSESTLIQLGYNTVVGQPQAAYVWLKSNTVDTYTVRLDFQGNSSNFSGTSSTLTVTPTWTKFFVGLTSASDTFRSLALRLRGTLGTSDYADILFAQMQHEQNALFSTSEIITTNAAETRARDIPAITDLSTINFNASEGSVVVEFVTGPTNASAASTVVQFNDGTTSNVLQVYAGTGTSGIFFQVVSGGVTSTAIDGGSHAPNTVYRAAVSWTANSFRFALNGTGLTEDTSGAVPIGLSALEFGRGGSNAYLNGELSKVNYYPRQLSQAQLNYLSVL